MTPTVAAGYVSITALQVNAFSLDPMSPASDFRSREFRLMAACVAISIGLHAALLLGLRMADFQVAAFNELATRVVDVRLATSQAPDATIAARNASADSEWRAMHPMSKGGVRARQYPAMLEFRPVDLPRRAFDEKAYLPLSKLTQPPTPIQRVAVPYPEGAAQGGSVTARLILFIDENGSVARVDVGTAELPAAFAVAAMETFETARFHPGEVDGTPVKVRMVIDVEFEDRGDPRFKRNRQKARV